MKLELLSDEVARRLVEASPGCDAHFSNSDGVLRVEWPSQNPRVEEPLVLDCKGEPSLYWFKGYMVDFPAFIFGNERQQAREIVEFLRRFFAERIACGVNSDGGGGPVWLDEDEPTAWWHEPGVIIRSWKGTRDSG